MTDIETLIAIWSWGVLICVVVPAGLIAFLVVRFLRA
jgi:hypothetical protein